MGVRTTLAVGATGLLVGVGIPVAATIGSEPGTALARQVVEEEDRGAERAPGQLRNAAVVADSFAISSEEALSLKQRGVGWGAMVKLLSIAEVTGSDVESLLAGVPIVEGEYEFDFEGMVAGLTADQQAELAAMPRGLGQLKKGEGWIPPGLAKQQGD